MPPKSPEEKSSALQEYWNKLGALEGEFRVRMRDLEGDQIDIAEFEVSGFICKGSFGRVYKARRGDQTVAIKVGSKAVLFPDHVEQTIQERKFLCAMDSDFVCKLIGKWKDPKHVFMYLDFAVYGDFFDTMEASHVDPATGEFKPITEEWVLRFASQMVCALEYIHACNIIHRDFRPENCVVHEGGRLKLIDFGLAVEGSTSLSGFAGNDFYCAPEMFKGECYTDAVDWWAFGISLYEILNQGYPFEYDPEKYWEVKHLIWNPLGDLDESQITAEAKDLLKGLLEKNPAERIGTGKNGADQVKQHQWFKNVDWYNVIFEKDQLELNAAEKRVEAFDAEELICERSDSRPAIEEAFEEF